MQATALVDRPSDQSIVMSAGRQIRRASKQAIKNKQCGSNPPKDVPQAESHKSVDSASQGGYSWLIANWEQRYATTASVKLTGSRWAADHTRWVKVLRQPPPRPCRPPLPLLDRPRPQLGQSEKDTRHLSRDCVHFTDDAPEGTPPSDQKQYAHVGRVEATKTTRVHNTG